jgi:hypothetical protein
VAKNSVEIDAKELTKILVRGGANAGRALSQALYREAALIFEESQDEVPLDTGNLRASGKLGLPQIQGSELVVEISYGGAAADYALVVHEDLERNYRNGKKSKYLEDPAKRRIIGLSGRLLRSVRKSMGI